MHYRSTLCTGIGNSIKRKRMTFYGIEITFDRQGAAGIETSMHTYCNCTADTVREIRETILAQGLQVPVSLVQWAVIFPAQIRTFTIYRQDKFFGNMHSTLTKTVFDAPKDGEQVKI